MKWKCLLTFKETISMIVWWYMNFYSKNRKQITLLYFKLIYKENYKYERSNLAGGLGTRLSEYTKTIPKPMINISGKPISII